MSQQYCAGRTPAVQPDSRLASGYDELTRLDQALREAERRLAAAHGLCGGPPPAQQAQEVYLEVLALRDCARRVLLELSELWIAER
ncbi:hypothetical protein ACFPOE_05645 [Caenimonas terrae]|uniref:EscE/YscE/SsaE family type III secretion system needle protein co-chaperone n=1 Tax=Caenimonas terrae TaxID=696074 RepID=A0ABW0NBS3_9BURK